MCCASSFATYQFNLCVYSICICDILYAIVLYICEANSDIRTMTLYGVGNKLIGKSKDGKFQTGPSASYPAGLCKFLAELISSVLRMGENELQPMRDASTGKSMGAASMVTDEEKSTVKSMGAASMVADDAKVVTDDDSGATAMSTDVIGGQEFPPKPLGVTGASEGTCVHGRECWSTHLG